MPTAEELSQLQDSITQKRLAVAEARSSREAQEQELAADIAYQNLQAESARLDLELAEEQARTDALSVGASAPLQAAKSEMEAALAAQSAQEEAAKAAAEAAAAAEKEAAAAAAETASTETASAPAETAAPSAGEGA